MHPSADRAGSVDDDPFPVIGAIPARFASTRLPGKALLPIAGKPMIEHVYERATAAGNLSRVVVLTDDRRIAEAVEAFGGDYEMTPEECASGTDRVAWAARSWSGRAVVNIQGDEPLIDPQAIADLASHLRNAPRDPVVTLAAEAGADEVDDPNVVKVVTNAAGYALYFSRATIPYRRSAADGSYLRHIGIYGYQIEALEQLASLPVSPLEATESLEQLRALENGIAIRVLRVADAWPGVDTMDDLKRIEAMVARA